MKQHGGFGGSGRREGNRGAASTKKGSVRAPELLSTGSRPPDWDFVNEACMEQDADPTDFHRQREELKYQLEKLGILGDKSESSMGGKTLLYNWRPSAVRENVDEENEEDGGDMEGPFNVNNYEEEGSPDMRSWLDAARDTNSAHGGFSALQHEGVDREEFRREKSFNRALRMPRMDRSSRNAQILSPLVLNTHEQDMQRVSQSRSRFTLEEPYEEEEEYFDEEAESDYTAVHNAAAFERGSRSHSPLGLGQQARRPSSRKHSSASSTRHIYAGARSVDVDRNRLRAGHWEDELFDYEVESVEVSRKESLNSYQRAKNLKLHQYFLPGKEAMVPPDPRKMVRRKNMGRQLLLRQQFGSASYCQRNDGAEGLPLLTELEDYNESEECATSSGDGDDGRLAKRGGMGLEASADAPHGRSLVKVEDKANLQLAFPECKELALCDYKPRNLSQKYRPKGFEEVVGQNIVTQALTNAILRGKIAPVYLFQGSRGTGKTSAARIFAAALICSSPEGKHPCGVCRDCISVTSGKCSEVKEVDAASNNGIEKVKALLEEMISAPPLSRYKVFIIDECHVLTTETWNALLKILEEPPMNVVFILVTTDPDQLPRTAVSRCQKFPFPKIKDSEIVKRLQQLADSENLAVNSDTLQLIASRSDGSLRDAEMTLDQLSLLGQEIKPSTVYELVGSASDERMLGLLDSALLADTVGTVRRARELVDSGVEPLSLMSRLATLITDILAGSFKFTESQRKGFFKKQTLSEEKLEWLRMAMKTLSEAEKQLRVSNDRATWLTAALLQLGPERSSMFPASCAGTSLTQSPVALDDLGENEGGEFEGMSSGRQTWDDDGNHGQNMSFELSADQRRHTASSHDPSLNTNRGHDTPSLKPQRKLCQEGGAMHSHASPHPPQASDKQPYDEDLSDDFVEDASSGQILSSSKLDEIWCRVVEKCPLPLRQLLHSHGKLISISMSEVDAVIHLEVSHPEHKAKCERSQKTIATIFKSVLGFPVEVRISLASLPAENEGTRNWASGGNHSLEQANARGTTGVLSSGNTQVERTPTKGYSLSQYGTARGATGGPNSNANHVNHAPTKIYSLSHWNHGMHQPEHSECFPAIPQASFGSPSQDNQNFDQAAAVWNSNNMRFVPSNSTVKDDGRQARAHNVRRVSPVMTAVSGNVSLHEGRRRHFQGMSEARDRYKQSVEYEDIDNNLSDGERHMELQSPEAHEGGPAYDMPIPRHSNLDGPLDTDSRCVDGRRSCDTDVQKRKGSSLKMVHRLTMRSRTRSLPSSNPNSPVDRGSSRFVGTKGKPNTQKHRDAQHSGDEGAEDFLEVPSVVGGPMKSKLKGAAGSFARFFKGK